MWGVGVGRHVLVWSHYLLPFVFMELGLGLWTMAGCLTLAFLPLELLSYLLFETLCLTGAFLPPTSLALYFINFSHTHAWRPHSCRLKMGRRDSWHFSLFSNLGEVSLYSAVCIPDWWNMIE